jgi:hypothetical protein
MTKRHGLRTEERTLSFYPDKQIILLLDQYRPNDVVIQDGKGAIAMRDVCETFPMAVLKMIRELT